jgi:nucleoside-diphosphate-sugar epimerase
MKFTVLGATGFIGKNLTASLRRAGHDVWTPVRDDAAIFTRPLGHVFYCIGLTSDFRTRPFDTVRAHVGVLTEVLERTHFESFVYLSSTRVYAGSDSAIENQPLRVNPSDSSDLYNLSKLTGEALCLSSGKSNVTVIRLSNVIGEDPNSANFLFELIREALEGKILLQSDPNSAKDYIWIEDVVRLLPQIAINGKHRLYNVASGRNTSHQEIIEKLVLLTSCEVAIAHAAPQYAFPPIDTNRIWGEFRFKPVSVLNQLPELIEAFLTFQRR